MKIYTAHNFAARNYITEHVVPRLNENGHIVTSRWLTSETHVASTSESKRQSALEDLEDVDAADALMLFVEQYGERAGRGKYVEMGYASKGGKKIFLIGNNPGCIFYNLPNLEHFQSLEEWMEVYGKTAAIA